MKTDSLLKGKTPGVLTGDPGDRLFYGLSNRLPAHPGRYLHSHFMLAAQLTQGQLAHTLGISRRRVNELLNGKRGVTPDTALRLSRVFGTDPHLWVNWQAAYDLHHAWRTLRGSVLGKGAVK